MNIRRMKPGVILSMEQALSMTYATLRFVQMGWRVIKVEATPRGQATVRCRAIRTAISGTPRWSTSDRRSYFVAPECGQGGDRAEPEVRRTDRRRSGESSRELNVDVFCCNTLPGALRRNWASTTTR